MTSAGDPTDGNGLFRTAVVERRRQRLYGEVLLSDSRISSAFVIAMGLFSLSLIIWAVRAEYPRTTQVLGVVTTSSPTAKVFAQRPGIVERLFVADGELVKKGQQIALISVDIHDNTRRSSAGDTLTALREQSDSIGLQLVTLNQTAAGERNRLAKSLSGTRAEYASISRQIALENEIVRSMTFSIDRLRPVVDRGFMSHVEMERREQALLAQRERLEQLTQQRTQLEARKAETEAQLGLLPIETARKAAEMRGQLFAVSQQQAHARVEVDYTVVAPVDGRVTAIQGTVGRSVDQRAPIMAIVPDKSKFEAEIFAPSRSAGFIRPGQEVRVMYDAFPYKQFGSFPGRIVSVSSATMAPAELDLPFKSDEPVYRVRLSLERQSIVTVRERLPLQSGMTLSANVILERRSFLDWLLEPLNALRKRS